MLHEVLLGLLGYSGSIIVDTTSGDELDQEFESNEHGFVIAPDFPFLKEGEKATLQRLCDLGFQYKYLERFVNSYSSFGSQKTDSESGLFVPAMAESIDKILNRYRERILWCENQALSDPGMPLVQLCYHLEDYFVVFTSLKELCSTVVHGALKGSAVIDAVSQRKATGIPIVRECMETVLQKLNRVLGGMLDSWMVHGELLDPYDEFFICKSKRDSTHVTTSTTVESKTDTENWSGKYTIRPTMLSLHIPLATAEKVLFVGRTINLLKNPKASHILGEDANSELEVETKKFSETLSRLMTAPVLHELTFGCEISKIHDIAGGHLWNLLVKKCKLVDVLGSLKGFYLMTRGEFWEEFINDTREMFLIMPRNIKQSQHDVNAVFKQVYAQFFTDSAESTPAYYLSLTDHDTDPWSTLSLEHRVKWPLDLLITEDVLRRYNSMFKLVFRIRCVETSLHKVWVLLMETCRRKEQEFRARLMPAWRLRTQISFLIENLLHYIQEDVIAVQWEKLKNEVLSGEDFRSVQNAHDSYLSSLTSLCFLNAPTVWKALDGIFGLCADFHGLSLQYLTSSSVALSGVDGMSRELESYLVSVDEMNLDFKRRALLLFTVLKGIRAHDAERALSQLLLRFDYNNYFSQSQKDEI